MTEHPILSFILQVLREEIGPKLIKFQEEKRILLEFRKKASELEKLLRIVVAYEWMTLQSRATKGNDTVSASEAKRLAAIEGKGRMEVEIGRMEKEVKDIEKRRDKELAKGGKVQKLEEEQKELARETTKLEAKVEIADGNVKEEEVKIQELEAAAKEVCQRLFFFSRRLRFTKFPLPYQLVSQKQLKLKDSTTSNEAFATLKVTYDQSTSSLKASEDLLQTLLTGISSSSDDTTNSGFMGQLATSKTLASNMGTEAERAKARIEHLQREVKEKEPRAKKAEKEGKGLIGELEKAKSEQRALEKVLSKLDWDEEKEASLRDKKDTEGKAVRKLLEVC